MIALSRLIRELNSRKFCANDKYSILERLSCGSVNIVTKILVIQQPLKRQIIVAGVTKTLNEICGIKDEGYFQSLVQ